MNRITRTALTAILAGAAFISLTATTADAAVPSNVPPGLVRACGQKIVTERLYRARLANPSTSAGASDYALATAGQEGVRLRQRRLGGQIGTVRTRIFDGIGAQVAHDHFGGGRYSVSRWLAVNLPNCWA